MFEDFSHEWPFLVIHTQRLVTGEVMSGDVTRESDVVKGH